MLPSADGRDLAGTAVSVDGDPGVDPDMRRRSRSGTRDGASFVERYAGVGLLLGLIALFSILKPDDFATYDNFIGIFGNESVSGIVALGILVVLAAGVFDVSIGGMMTLAVVEMTWLFQSTEGAMPVWGAVASPSGGQVA